MQQDAGDYCSEGNLGAHMTGSTPESVAMQWLEG